MKHSTMHNENLKTFEDKLHHLELKVERLEAAKANDLALVADAGSHRPSWPKNEKVERADLGPLVTNNFKHKKGKRGGKKFKAKGTCFNYDKLGHFARDCTEPKKVFPNFISRIDCFVSSQATVAYSPYLWVINSGATDHITRNKVRFIEYHQVLARSK